LSDTEHSREFDRQNPADPFEAGDTTIDRRARRTRQALHETLMHLVVERGYDAISVSDIVDAANVGRSTFYAHFTDKDDLLRSMASMLRNVLVSEHGLVAAETETASDRVLGFSRFMTRHLQEQHDLYRALMRGRAGPIVLDLIRHALCDIVRKELPADAKPDRLPNREVTVQFLVGGYMSVLTWWLDRGAIEPPDEVEAAFRELARNGL
jgi:AcrR family transcriptional regulator